MHMYIHIYVYTYIRIHVTCLQMALSSKMQPGLDNLGSIELPRAPGGRWSEDPGHQGRL